MNQTAKFLDDAGILRLAGAMDIYASAQLRDALWARFAGAGDIAIDLKDVDRCDAAGVQLLFSARRTAAQSARILHFRNVSGAVRECCRRLGLPEEF